MKQLLTNNDKDLALTACFAEHALSCAHGTNTHNKASVAMDMYQCLCCDERCLVHSYCHKNVFLTS